MSKGFYREIIKALSDIGYQQVKGGKGSHEKWRCQKTGRLTIVPKNLKSKHTANSILIGAGLEKKY